MHDILRGQLGGRTMEPTLIYWKGKQLWPGKFLGHTEIVSQWETPNKLEVTLKNTHKLLVPEDMPIAAWLKELSL
jgi:hypothetical protein